VFLWQQESACAAQGSLHWARVSPENEASSPPLQQLLSEFMVPLLMVRSEAAGEGVRGLEGADCALPRHLAASDLHAAATSLFS